MINPRRNVLVLRKKPRFTRFPARPFYNLCLGGITRPNAIFYPSSPAVRKDSTDITKSLTPASLPIEETTFRPPKKMPKDLLITRTPILPIQRGGAKELPTEAASSVEDTVTATESKEEEEPKEKMPEGTDAETSEKKAVEEKQTLDDDTKDKEIQIQVAQDDDIDSDEVPSDDEEAIAQALLHPLKVLK